MSAPRLSARNETVCLTHEERVNQAGSPIGLRRRIGRWNEFIGIRVHHSDLCAGDRSSRIGVDNLECQLELAFILRRRRGDRSRNPQRDADRYDCGTPEGRVRHGTKTRHGPASFATCDGAVFITIGKTGDGNECSRCQNERPVKAVALGVDHSQGVAANARANVPRKKNGRNAAPTLPLPLGEGRGEGRHSVGRRSRSGGCTSQRPAQEKQAERGPNAPSPSGRGPG